MTVLTERATIHFTAPDSTTAPAPPEYRGLTRDGVRLLVAQRAGITHTRFAELAEHLHAGDLLVVNNSATIAGQMDAELLGRGQVVVHVATRLDDGSRVVEIRTAPDARRAVLDAGEGDIVRAHDVTMTLLSPYPRRSSPVRDGNRLWRAAVDGPLPEVLERNGRAISYGYLDRDYPLAAYQSVFAIRPGSAEMPSAGRPFTTDLVTRLVALGMGIAPITLHTGLSSQEAGEAPQPERYEVGAATARLVNATKAAGGRIIAVGTTATRALESAVDSDGLVTERVGWTERVVTPANPPRIVDGLITGWHDPGASHLLLVEAVAGAELAQRAYDAAVSNGYLWHEFGDSALLLP
ncbi:S-adenosylmethionine:tRNA ribosyltransferase-isomerase [Microlunatus sp. Gsoil 973]|uniref:S-adenosylmethionine:tRNA ribosyltransferase-isomerase n=1 Tax=Microlunatus sp. Gsoil 973 TaxID=2672569 RepID=UPI0012B45C37|nr:S-adenosylmethionine:tRNA ribosyltransferase-isomerase [Microlunatus sp. Gsoil 973]QGN34816.1 S-adenosylmethionine:tRNA ribosyltransferase-isomerase [Microlunatus sp. Gsoil 973]